MALQDAVWQLGVTLRGCMNKFETIRETNPEIHLDSEIARAKHTLERYSKGAMLYKPNPFGLKYDDCTLRDQLADFPPSRHEIKVPQKTPISPLIMLEDGECEECEGQGQRAFAADCPNFTPCPDCNGTGKVKH